MEAPRQLKMFMSPHEIMGEYQPLDADREVAGIDIDRNSYGTKEVATDPGARPNRNGARNVRNRIRAGEIESDAEVWSRKAIEGHNKYEPSLQSSIAQHGVQMPVHLSEQFGAVGKRTVAGGHHRIASANDVDPHGLMPVIHHLGPGRAANIKHGPYRYT